MSNSKLILTYILFFAAFFRLFGLNWDQGAHLHPDERFLTMVATSLKWPASFSQYLDPITSPLNPANAGYPFFVYGTFPLFFVKALAALFGMDDYNNLTFLGRAVSALFDLGTVYLVYLITSNIVISKYRNIASFLASFFYASSILPIQLSHFFAVDTFLVFFLTLSFFLLIKLLNSNNQAPNSKQSQNSILLGIVFGLALASKISALLFLPIIIIGLWLKVGKQTELKFKEKFKTFNLFLVNFTFYFLLFTLGAYISMRLVNPYTFANSNLFNPTISPLFLQNLKTLKSLEGENTSFPPAIQWLTSEPLLFPLRNMLYYGLGIPLGILAVLGFIYALFYLLRHLFLILKKTNNYEKGHDQLAIAYKICLSFYRLFPLLLMVLWVGGLFLYQGTQFAKAMRYFTPIYPFLTILAAFFVFEVVTTKKSAFKRILVHLASLLKDWTVNLIFLIPYLFNFVKSPNLTKKWGVEMPGVAPGRFGLTVQSSKLAIPTPFAILKSLKSIANPFFTCLPVRQASHFLFFILILVWPLSFLSIYARPHSRIAASYWIYQNIPEGSTLTCEHWDDCLPLPITTVRPWYFGLNKPQNRNPTSVIKSYKTLELPLYDPDTAEKWEKISQTLKQADYIILSSNRLFGSIPSVPQRYPITTQFYTLLFAEKLDFRRVAEFTSRPHLPIPFLKLCLAFPGESYGHYARKGNPCEAESGFTIVDDSADESLTVYDHPKVIIFQKDKVRP